MKKRKVKLPMLSARVFVLVCGAIVATGICFGAAMRASLTHYASDGSVDGLPYVLSSRARGEELVTHSREEIDSAIEQTAQDLSISLSDAASVVSMTSEDVFDDAPLVVTATFTGEREYVYQAFQCKVEVSSVLKGEGVHAGDELLVYDAYKIVEPDNGTGGGQFGDAREVWTSGTGASQFGLTPMREGQEYLFFLEEKRYPEAKDPSSYRPTYCLVKHPYARISVDIVASPEHVGVFADPVGADWERTTFAEACRYDIAVADEDAKKLYLDTCARILTDTL